MSNLQGPSWLAFPMHGQQKLLSEGYRTRDGHFIEWLGKLNTNRGPVDVISRPEPQVLRPAVAATVRSTPALNTRPVTAYSWAIPNPRDRRRWWVQSLSSYRLPPVSSTVPAVIWNPLASTSNIGPELLRKTRVVVADLLDDWTVHFAFQTIRKEVDEAYATLFERADFVTANSEGTMALAERYGRSDAQLLLNGCDPSRFAHREQVEGPITVGYVGKIGRRVDLELILKVANDHPNVQFVFAGPILDSEYRRPLANVSNVKLLGDVHYNEVPRLMQRFDIGWVPHRVGKGEVGGDVIKTYEYRASGLPVLTTPVIGAGSRDLSNVVVADVSEQSESLTKLIAGMSRVDRVEEVIPEAMTWENKARLLQSFGYED